MADNASSSQESQRLGPLRDLARVMGTDMVSTSLWACLQVCDFSKLKPLTRIIQQSQLITSQALDRCPELPKIWFKDRSALNSIASGTSSTSRDSLSKCMRIVARRRDGHRCVLTGTADTYQPVWIFPEALTKSAFDFDFQYPCIWKLIDLFWDQARVERWRNAVFNNPDNATHATSGCSSLICLRNDLAHGFVSAMFALRPVRLSSDKREIEVEFHWLPREKHGFSDLVNIEQQPRLNWDLSGVDGLKFSAAGSNELIRSGHRFLLTTDDAAKRPLPDFDLLDMTWNLSRIVAMSSAIDMVCDEPGVFGSGSQSDDDKTVINSQRVLRYMATGLDSAQRVEEWLACDVDEK